MPFRKDFLWGAATAATQIEGAWDEDGKCPSIWDVSYGHIKNGDTCHVACDHYHRYKEDVQLLKQIGVKSYRFSVNMCRVMTEEGKIDPKGLDFYSDLVDELLKNGIVPLCTLYHWDLPQWAQDKGGWKNDQIVDWYLQYAEETVSRLSDRVQYWMTFNEPQIFIMMGYVTGTFAPYRHDVLSFRKHHLRNMLLAHGKCVKMIREKAKTAPKIGIAMASSAYIPLSESAEDIDEAYRLSFESQIGEGSNGMYMDPIGLGKASKMLKKTLSEEDLKIISEPLDFVGLNVYQPSNPMGDKKYKAAYEAEKHPKTSMGWVIDGRCLYWTVRHYWRRYHLPIMITENGMADTGVFLNKGDEINDEIRVAFLDEFLKNLKRAADEDIPVLGYQHWSFLDNFEWNEGYGPRFGLVRVDYDTQKRTLKNSAYHYQHIIETNGEEL
ncbi:MAG: family 1 glycosylhydrolase [Erysipelotrichaceae bacterium]|nr:family 1 glycosylhydrolase [Erysipelotrichaceae bacterium]